MVLQVGLSHNLNDYIWFGLLRNLSDKNKWLWSGGGQVTELCWKQDQPENRPNEDYGLFDNKKWRDAHADHINPVFCYSTVVVEEEKTWEEALEYCREHHDDLASVASETEMLLIQKELNKYHTTKHVWIGLRFLSKDWIWVDGQEMDYEAWDEGGKPLCPQAKMKCAALQKTGGRLSSWRAHDCEKRLSFICY
uniref:C-type lectin domain-containing protein n=1 Tax=Pundamilia nyererei TaxID=303518 RepID=A0A3B4FPU9_9CICH